MLDSRRENVWLVLASVDPEGGFGVMSRAPLGYRRIGSTSHIARLSASAAAEIMHRRSHAGVDKIRVLAHSTVFVDFIKVKLDVQAPVDRIIAAFDATVGTPTDSSGRALPRPRVRLVHSGREGGLMSDAFSEYRASAKVHLTTSPPHDHDLNAIAERTIGVISERAIAVRLATEANPRLWPYIASYVLSSERARAPALEPVSELQRAPTSQGSGSGSQDSIELHASTRPVRHR